MKKTQLTPYLAAGAAAVTASQADAATIVTFYGPGAQNPSTDPATPAGISIGTNGDYLWANNTFSFSGFFALDPIGDYFSRGTDIAAFGPGFARYYDLDNSVFFGGAVAGDQNYANISLWF